VLLATISLDPAQGAALMLGLLLRFLGLFLVLSLGLAAVDYLWQVIRHRAQNRMSHQELIEEFRDAEGDPQTKAQRRQRGQDIAMNRMLADVPRADVVIVNPTHYAVALTWHRDRKEPPICVAKGVDEGG
jgi:flagellar biosynthetic protein FlhB